MESRPCGVFDSGVGGLSILREMRLELPHEDLLYLADQAHVPYGRRSVEEVRTFSEGITRFLLRLGAKLIVVACNTASAATLHHLRTVFPEVPFVGMEPAVKPAAQGTRSGVVGVLATEGTLKGELHASVKERFAEGVEIIEASLPGMVELLESDAMDENRARAIVEQALSPLLERGADTLVLACTHYPFLLPLITESAGPQVRVIDPSPAIARQAARLLEAQALAAPQNHRGTLTLFTSGDPAKLAAQAQQLIGLTADVAGVRWDGLRLELLP